MRANRIVWNLQLPKYTVVRLPYFLLSHSYYIIYISSYVFLICKEHGSHHAASKYEQVSKSQLKYLVLRNSKEVIKSGWDWGESKIPKWKPQYININNVIGTSMWKKREWHRHWHVKQRTMFRVDVNVYTPLRRHNMLKNWFFCDENCLHTSVGSTILICKCP